MMDTKMKEIDISQTFDDGIKDGNDFDIDLLDNERDIIAQIESIDNMLCNAQVGTKYLNSIFEINIESLFDCIRSRQLLIAKLHSITHNNNNNNNNN